MAKRELTAEEWQEVKRVEAKVRAALIKEHDPTAIMIALSVILAKIIYLTQQKQPGDLVTHVTDEIKKMVADMHDDRDPPPNPPKQRGMKLC